MDLEVKSWLYDILNAIHEIEGFLTDTPNNFEAFQHDLKTRRAVERNIEIIGEALKRILHKEPHFELSHSRKIVDTRNRIIHGYDSVSDEIIWSIIITHLPTLNIEVSALLKE